MQAFGYFFLTNRIKFYLFCADSSGYARIRRYIYAQNKKPYGSSKKCPRWYMSGKTRTYLRREPTLSLHSKTKGRGVPKVLHFFDICKI